MATDIANVEMASATSEVEASIETIFFYLRGQEHVKLKLNYNSKKGPQLYLSVKLDMLLTVPKITEYLLKNIDWLRYRV